MARRLANGLPACGKIEIGLSSDLENNNGREIICSRPLHGQSHGESNVYIVRRPLSSVVSGRHDGRAHRPTTPIKRKENDPDDDPSACRMEGSERRGGGETFPQSDRAADTTVFR